MPKQRRTVGNIASENKNIIKKMSKSKHVKMITESMKSTSADSDKGTMLDENNIL
jgi:hypothetical protein